MGTYDEEAAKYFQIIDYDYDENTINTEKDIVAFGWHDFLLFGKLSKNKQKFCLSEPFDDMTFNVYDDLDWGMCIDVLDMNGHPCTYLGLSKSVKQT